MGMFYNFIDDKDVRLIGCEAAGKGIDTKLHAATIAKGEVGIFHGMKSIFARTKTARSTKSIPFQPVSTIPVSGRNTPI